MRIPRSKKLMDQYTTLRRTGVVFKNFIWNLGDKSNLHDSHREKFNQASDLVRQALNILEEIYGPEIGKEIINDLKTKVGKY